jgi:hypothetical protein
MRVRNRPDVIINQIETENPHLWTLTLENAVAGCAMPAISRLPTPPAHRSSSDLAARCKVAFASAAAATQALRRVELASRTPSRLAARCHRVTRSRARTRGDCAARHAEGRSPSPAPQRLANGPQ